MALTAAFESLVGRVITEFLQRGQPRGHGQRVAGKCAGLKHRPGRHDMAHDVGPAAEGADRQSATDNLAKNAQVGRLM